MKLLKQYRFGFDLSGLLFFLLVMLPNFIWFAVPAPNDILRAESVTPIVDVIASICQVLTVACLCFLINKKRGKLRFSPLVITAVICVAVYYLGWTLHYSGIANFWIILLLTLPPCLAFILFSADRKNLPAVLFVSVFAVGHLIFALVNFVLK